MYEEQHEENTQQEYLMVAWNSLKVPRYRHKYINYIIRVHLLKWKWKWLALDSCSLLYHHLCKVHKTFMSFYNCLLTTYRLNQSNNLPLVMYHSNILTPSTLPPSPPPPLHKSIFKCTSLLFHRIVYYRSFWWCVGILGPIGWKLTSFSLFMLRGVFTFWGNTRPEVFYEKTKRVTFRAR